MLHRGAWGNNPAYGTRIDTAHFDEIQPDFTSGFVKEFNFSTQLYNAPFIFEDYDEVGRLAAAIPGETMNYAVANSMAPLKMRTLGIKTPDDAARHLIRQISVREKQPGSFSIHGKPVLFVFNISAFTPTEWKTILQKVRAAIPGQDLLAIGQRSVFEVLGLPNPQAYMTEVLAVFDGIMFWGGPLDAKLKNLEFARQAMKTLAKNKLLFWVLTNGYWRPEKGMFRGPIGTQSWRDQLELCFKDQFDGVIIESWNDLEENTDVLPSVNKGGVIFELLKYYSAISNGHEYYAAPPGLLLTQPREILAGDTLRVEVLSLPVKIPRRTFRLELDDDDDGATVYRSPEQLVPPDAAEEFIFSIPTRSLAESKRLAYRIVVDGKTFATGSWTTLRNSRLESPWTQGAVLGSQIPSEEISFHLRPEGAMRKAEIRVRHDVPLSRVDIYRNGHPVWSMDADRLNQKHDWQHGPVGIELDFQMPQYDEETPDRSGVMMVTGGALVRGFDMRGESLVTAPNRAEWNSPRQPGVRQFNVKLLADADDSTCLTVNLTKLNQTFSFTMGELRGRGIVEYKTSPHGRVWIRETDNPVIWKYMPGALGTGVDETVLLHPAGEIHENEYWLWVVDKDGKTFRSQPVTIFHEKRKGEDAQWLWDETAGQRFSAMVSRDEQMEEAWSFDGTAARVYPDEGGSGALLRLGGGMFRVGHFEPDAVPSIVERASEKALHFDGTDYAQIDAGAFPQGAFEMSLDVCPEKFTAFDQTLFFNQTNLTLCLKPDGRVDLKFTEVEGAPQPQELLGAEKIPLNQWSHISVRYDYQKLTLEVNGKSTSVPLAQGPAWDVSSESYLGARVGGTQGTQVGNGFTGQLDNLKIRCGVLAR